MSDDNPPLRWSRAERMGLRFRRITDADLPFLARVYASTRAEELATVSDWSNEQKPPSSFTSFVRSMLYKRLGFAVDEDKGIYDLMRWRAP
jgi:hypothetical protein